MSSERIKAAAAVGEDVINTATEAAEAMNVDGWIVAPHRSTGEATQEQLPVHHIVEGILSASLPRLRETWKAEVLPATRWQASNSGEWFCLACDDWVDECEVGDCAMGKVRALLSAEPHDTPAVVEGRVG